jgi:hypothetical protein
MRTRHHHVLGDRGQQLRDDDGEDQMPKASQGQQRHHQCQSQQVEDPQGAEEGQGLPGRCQPGRVQPGQPPDHRVVQDRDRDGGALQAAVEDHDRQDDQDDQGDKPADAAGLQVMGQRRCFA